MSFPPHDQRGKPSGHMWTWTQYAPPTETSPDLPPTRHQDDEDEEELHEDDGLSENGYGYNDVESDDDENSYRHPGYVEDEDEEYEPTVPPELPYSTQLTDQLLNPNHNTVPDALSGDHYTSLHGQRPNYNFSTSDPQPSSNRELGSFGGTEFDQPSVEPLANGEDLFESSANAGDDGFKKKARVKKDNLGPYGAQRNNYSTQPAEDHGRTALGSGETDDDVSIEAHTHQVSNHIPSYLRNPQGQPSPTESQLLGDDFEFHRGLRGLSEEQQTERFGRIADMSAIKNIEPMVSRKQQWYAFKQAHLVSGEGGDEFDEDEVEAFTKMMNDNQDCRCHGSSAKCSCPGGQCGCAACGKHATVEKGGCGCNGDASKCGCSPSQCRCEGCGHSDDDGDDQSVPMDIGKTPITPTFPRTGRIPGLGNLTEDPQPEHDSTEEALSGATAQTKDPDAIPQSESERNPPRNPGCSCICGDDCRCLKGRCNCDAKQPPRQEGRESCRGDRLANKPLGFLIKKAAEENKGQHKQPAGPPPRMTPIDEPPRRPDTPRPFDDSIRQSVEPEGPPPDWYRRSTPAYEDRSPSPSPLSHHGDVHMRDATRTLTRENSMPPPNFETPRTATSQSPTRQPRPAPMPLSPTPVHYSDRRLGRPTGQPASAARPSGYEMHNQMQPFPNSAPSQLPPGAYQLPRQPPIPTQAPPQRTTTSFPQHSPPSQPSIPAPPVPSDSLQPAKTRKSNTSSRRKSVVADSGISKAKSRAVSRKVTAKQAKPPKEKTAAQKKKDDGKVAAAVKKIEDKERKEKEKRDAREKDDAVKKQEDGAPVRRSGRIREKRESGNFGGGV